MDMGFLDRITVILCKVVSVVSTTFGLGAGETWPGEIALKLRPHIAHELSKSLENGVILVAGTNGKTTTSLMIKEMLEAEGKIVVHNATGANLLNGVVSSFIRHADWLGRVGADVGIVEIDENSLPIVLADITPVTVVILNLFRDQLDRYGETDVILEKWTRALSKLPHRTTLVLDSDDPGIAWLGRQLKGKLLFFGINDPEAFLKKKEHATDTIFCPRCGTRLRYKGVYYSHLGIWFCPGCGLIRPEPTVTDWKTTLPGFYNRYNTLAAVAAAKSIGVPEHVIQNALSSFRPAFGRQEEIHNDGRTIKLFLAKNPAGFNATLRTVTEQQAKDILLVLNDRIPDGRDVSWIWDVDFEMLPKQTHIMVSGDRVYDLALRLKYADFHFDLEPRLADAVGKLPDHSYVLATYSGMLEVRKLLTGKKIL